MGFSGGGSNITKPHTHDSTVLQDGGSLAANVTQFGLTAGSILYSDGSNIQELAVGSASDALVVNGAATAPEWASAGGALYELVGTTTTLDTTTYANKCYHLAFSSIDMTSVTALEIFCSVPMDINSLGFRFNENASDYHYTGSASYDETSTVQFGSNSIDAFFLGYWNIGNLSQSMRWSIQCDESGESDYMQMMGIATGSGSASDRTGTCYAGARQNTDTSQAITSISLIEDGVDCLAGGRLTVYKVTR